MENFLIELAKILVPVALSYIALLKAKAEISSSVNATKADVDIAFGKIREVQTGEPGQIRKQYLDYRESRNASSPAIDPSQVPAGELQTKSNTDSGGRPGEVEKE